MKILEKNSYKEKNIIELNNTIQSLNKDKINFCRDMTLINDKL